MRFLSLTFFLCYSIIAHTQLLEPVKWRFDSNQTGPDTYDLFFIADIDKEWKVYSQFTGDDGPVPTSINYESGNVEKKGDGTETGDKKEGYDKMFDTNVIAFTGKKPFMIKQTVKITDVSKPVRGYLTYMTCNNETCLPPTDVDFKFTFKVNGDQQKLVRDTDGKIVDPKLKAPANSKTQAQGQLQIESLKTNNTGQTKKPTQIDVKKIEDNVANTKIDLQAVENVKVPAATMAIDNVQDEVADADDGFVEPIQWSFDINDTGGGNYDLIYTATIDDGWTVYSLYTDDNGPYPTTITFEDDGGAKVIGQPTETGYKKQGPDPFFDDVEVIKYLSKEPFVINQKINSATGDNIKGYLTYMACDDSGCLPPTDVDFTFDLKNKKVLGQAIPLGTAASSDDVGMNIEGNKLDQVIPQLIKTYESPLGDCGTAIQSANDNYLKIFIGGFIGGLLAILLPCIFPMIPITVSFFTKDTKRKGWVNGLIYGLSIVGIFVTLGLALTALLGPTALNELSTNWIANVIFFLIFIAFAISFFGYYEITLPSSWSTMTDQQADKGGLIGIFFMAATLAIVSFSCTGPIIGSALVQVADNKMGPFFIMLGFSIALAIPFGLFAAFPAWLNSLPKSGSWMNSVKVVLGFLELALALKFLSVADMTSNWGFLKYELFMGLWVIIFAAMTAYLFGFIKFPHDSPVKKLSTTRKVFGVLSLLWTLYMASGFMIDKDINSYKIPKLVSGITPPASYNFFLKQNELDTDIKKRFPSYSKCANDINCFKDYYEALAYAKEVNKPVLLDFTGYGCVNCRKTEDYIWKDPKVKSLLNDDYVLASLYVDDRKKLDKTYYSTSREVPLRNVGNKWADFQIVNFKQNSQPLYVPITADQEVITLPRGYEEGVDNYKQFLDCALEINGSH